MLHCPATHDPLLTMQPCSSAVIAAIVSNCLDALAMRSWSLSTRLVCNFCGLTTTMSDNINTVDTASQPLSILCQLLRLAHREESNCDIFVEGTFCKRQSLWEYSWDFCEMWKQGDLGGRWVGIKERGFICHLTAFFYPFVAMQSRVCFWHFEDLIYERSLVALSLCFCAVHLFKSAGNGKRLQTIKSVYLVLWT